MAAARNNLIREIAEWVLTIAGAFILVMLLNTKVFATTRVQQSSMENTLIEGQHLVVEKLTYNFGSPQRGDIVVFIENKPIKSFGDEIKVFFTDISDVLKPANQKTNIRLVKRVIGIPGDMVDIRSGIVYVNGIETDEPFVKGNTEQRSFSFPVAVPAGKYIVMGDNRMVSLDSRSFGFIDENQVEGKVVFRFWPLKNFGILN